MNHRSLSSIARPSAASLVLVLLTLAAGLAPNHATAQQQPLKRWDEITYPALKNFTPPPVETFTLDNGITFYLVEDRELPLVNVRVTVRTGSVMDPDDKVGLAEVMADVIRSGGSLNYPADELNELLENKAAFIESSMGFTSGGATLNALTEDVDELLPVLVDVIQNPLFPQDKIDLALTQYRSSVSRRNDDQGGIANREFERLIYGADTPYGRMMEYATLDAITREDIVDMHRQAYVGSNMLIGVVGDFDVDEMKRQLSKAFGSIPTGSPTRLILPEIDYDYDSSISFIDKRDVNQSYVLLGHIGGRRSNPDYAALQVMNEVLSGGFSGRLFQVVRTDLGLAYAVFGSYGSGTLYDGQFYTGVMTQSATTAQAIDAIIGQIRRMQDEPIRQEELDRTRDQFLNSLVFKYDSKAKVLNERLSNDYVGLPADAFEKLIDEIKAVTIADVQRVARQYLRPDALRILVVGNGAEIGDQLARYGEINEIDITIPVPAPAASSVESGDAEEGARWIARMSEALLPGGVPAGAIVTEGATTLQTPNGPMQLASVERLDFGAMTMRMELSAPFGEIVQEFTESSGSQSMAGQAMALPEMAVKAAWDAIKRSPLWIAVHASSVKADYLGEVEMDGGMLVKLQVTGDHPVTLYLDPATALPVRYESQSFNPQMGGNVETIQTLDDYRLSDGVMRAYATSVTTNGEPSMSFKGSAHSVEKE